MQIATIGTFRPVFVPMLNTTPHRQRSKAGPFIHWYARARFCTNAQLPPEENVLETEGYAHLVL